MAGNGSQSVLWNYYSRVPNDPCRAVCNLCQQTLVQDALTSNIKKLMARHLRYEHHSSFVQAFETDEEELAKYIRGNTSKVWNYYVKASSSTVNCKICQRLIHYSGSTSNLWKHVKSHRGEIGALDDDVGELVRRPPPPLHQPCKRPKGFYGLRSNRSIIWKVFVKDQIRPVAMCKICSKELSVQDSSTSNLLKHMKRKHPDELLEAERSQDEELSKVEGAGGEFYNIQATDGMPEGNPKLEPHLALKAAPVIRIGMPASSLPNKRSFTEKSNKKRSFASSLDDTAKSHKKKRNINQSMMRMLAQEMLSPELTASQAFRDFILAIDVNARLPTGPDFPDQMLDQLVEETKAQLKLELTSASSISMSIESWRYKNIRDFLTLSAHYLRRDWTMASVVLDTIDCTDNKTETNMASSLKQVTDDWMITEKVMALVSNVPDDIISAASLVHGWDRLTCYGHLLNQLVLEAFNEVAEVVALNKKVAAAVTYVSMNPKAAETLASVQSQHNLPPNELLLPRDSDWTSSFDMFERLVEQYEAVNTVLCYWGRDSMCICDDDMDVVRAIVSVLEPFEAAIRELCISPYTSISMVIPIAALLQQVVSPDPNSEETHGPHVYLKESIASRMYRYLSSPETNWMLAAATLLDPRFKQHAFTDPAALEAAQNKLILDTQVVIQNRGSSQQSSQSTASDSTLTDGRWKKSTSFWNRFDQKVVDAGAVSSDVSEAENETRRFFKEVNAARSFDPLRWWRLNEVQYPNLKVLACKYLCVPATAVPSTRVLSKQGVEFSKRRDMLKPSHLRSVVFLNQNLQ